MCRNLLHSKNAFIKVSRKGHLELRLTFVSSPWARVKKLKINKTVIKHHNNFIKEMLKSKQPCLP